MKPTMRCMMLAVTVMVAAGSATAAELVYRSPTGVTFTVTEQGLTRIAHGDRVVAEGCWLAWNAGPGWFGRGDKDAPLAWTGYSQGLYAAGRKQVQKRSIEVLTPTHARVRHEMPHAVAVHDFRFDGEDVAIAARLENNHPSASIDFPALGGLRFAFTREPDGPLNVWHMSYLTKVGLGVFHPAHLNKVGGCYASDDTIGIGATPVFRGLERTLLFWDYDKWNPDDTARANRWLTCLRGEPIPSGGAMTFAVILRVSPETDWKHLLDPYKQQFLAAFGGRTYDTDFRCVAVAHVNRNKEAIGPGNPYGFHGGFRRLDLPEGVKSFCDTLIPGLKVANGQGVILWGQGGQEPRGQMYRADFDILPPEVHANWPTLASRFKEAGLRLGVTTRPRHMHVRADWENDITLDINPDDPHHLKILGDRFQHMIERGVSMFYLDSFGSEAGDVKIMRYLRQRLGPNISTFAEHSCDVMAVYSAFYSETDFWAKGSAKWVEEDQWRPRTPLELMKVVNWMLGSVPVISRAYDIHGKIPDGFESASAFFYRHGMAPMLADYKVAELAPEVRALQDRHVNPDGSRR